MMPPSNGKKQRESSAVDQEETPKQWLGRLIHIGQILSGAEEDRPIRPEARGKATSLTQAQDGTPVDDHDRRPEDRGRKKHRF
jgi:hypothetical protein